MSNSVDAVQGGGISDSANVAVLPLSPGQKLRAAREKAGLSIDEVASLLFLHVDFIVHLETDQFDALPGPTFAKGYLKAYARLVNVPCETVLSLYGDSCSEGAPNKTSGNLNSVPRMTAYGPVASGGQSKRMPIRGLFSLLPHVLTVLVILAGLGWLFLQETPALDRAIVIPFLKAASKAEIAQSHQSSSTPAEPEAHSSLSVEGDNSGQSTFSASVSPENQPATARVDDSEVNKVEEPVSVHVGTVVDQPLKSESLLSQLPKVWGGEQLPGMRVKHVSSQPGMGDSFSIDVELKDQLGVELNPNRLRLAFLETAKVYVEDGAGVSAHNETHARGSEVQVALFGPPPYLITVSTPEAVAVRFNDQPVVLPRTGS